MLVFQRKKRDMSDFWGGENHSISLSLKLVTVVSIPFCSSISQSTNKNKKTKTNPHFLKNLYKHINSMSENVFEVASKAVQSEP